MDFSFTDAIFGAASDIDHDENLWHSIFTSSPPSHFKGFHHDPADSNHSFPDFTTTTTSNHHPASSHHPLQPPAPSPASTDVGPFSVQCRIPVPGLEPLSRYHLWLETSFMCRRNERERQRVRNVNDGFSRLRNHLPRSPALKRRQSKVETLQRAIQYIRHLQSLLDEAKEDSEPKKDS